MIRRVTFLLSPSKNIQFCNEQIRTRPLFSPPCASATYGSARMCGRKNSFETGMPGLSNSPKQATALFWILPRIKAKRPLRLGNSNERNTRLLPGQTVDDKIKSTVYQHKKIHSCLLFFLWRWAILKNPSVFPCLLSNYQRESLIIYNIDCLTVLTSSKWKISSRHHNIT